MGAVNICALIPTLQRVGMTVETIKRIKAQEISPNRIVVVGSHEDDMEIPNLIEVDYLNVPNNPLGAKIQSGVEYCRQFDSEGLLMCGSDDWLSVNWTKVLLPYLGKYDAIGSDCIYAILFYPERGIEIKRCSYENTIRKGEPVGPGRLLSRRILDKIDWKLYSKDIESSLDKDSFKKLRSVGAKIFVEHDEKIKILSPKGDWSTINNWDCYRKFGKSMSEPEQWLEDNFPDALETLCKLTNTKLEVGIIVQNNENRKKIWSDYANT